MAATAEELADLYRSARRERAELERSRRRVDRLAREAVRAKDHEGALIAHRIHDTAAQSMVSAFRFLDAARTTAAGEPGRPAVDRQLEEASDRLLTAIREVRGVLAQVLPPGLEELGVGPAIEARHRFLLTEGVPAADGNPAARHVGGEVRGELPRLVDWVEQALYSITSEAIANAVRHSGAGRIDVTLTEMRGRAVVTVEDDGRGIPSRTARDADGHGLGILGMTRQTSWLGGRIAIGPRRGGGTRIRISIPVDRHRRPGSAVAPRGAR
jgi:two-component system sensor histidine kinase UhpB